MYSVNKTWADVQKTIRTLGLRLEEWQLNLPEKLAFEGRTNADEMTETDIRHVRTRSTDGFAAFILTNTK
jgi:hypothetical protein